MPIYSYFFVIYVVVSIYHSLTIYQQAHYEIREYLRYIIRYIHIEAYSLFFILVISIANDVVISSLGSIILGLGVAYLHGKKRIGLKITNRIKRFLIMTIPFTIIIIYFYPFIFLIRFFLVALMILSNAIEGIINKGYQTSAKHKFQTFDGICIGITGSFAKTTTKLFLSQLMNSYPNLSTIKSYNTLNGISLMINNNDLNLYDYLILEMGASHKNDIKKICSAFGPTIGIVTSIGYMHLNTFKTMDTIIKEKMSLIESLPQKGLGIINYENEYIRSYKLKSNAYVLTYGFNYGDFKAKVNKDIVGIYYFEKNILSFKRNNLDEIDILNLMPGIILSILLGVNEKEIVNQINRIKKPPARQEIKQIGRSILIDDSYNSNIAGAVAAVNKMKLYPGKKIIITPGIVENDKVINQLYAEYSKVINENVDEAYIVRCRTSKELYDKISIKKEYVKSVNSVIKLLDFQESAVILIENDIPDIYV